MSGQIRRYVFVDFETLRKVKFKKLEKVCDKIFVFVAETVEQVPMPLVREMQRMGNAVKWVTIAQAASSEMNYHICFLLGKLHEKISLDVEFAILSNDTTFDPLVQFVNQTGRNCLRVRQKDGESTELHTPHTNAISTPPPILNAAQEMPNFEATNWATDEALSEHIHNADLSSQRHDTALGEPLHLSIATDERETQHRATGITDDGLVRQTAAETVQRLLRSGNRPSEVTLLRNYILLHNQEPTIQSKIDHVIRRLEDNRSIEIAANKVTYYF